MGDEAAGELRECFVDVCPSFPPDPQAAEAVQPGENPLHDLAVGVAAGDRGHDAAGADRVSVDVVVVAAVGEQQARPLVRPSDRSRHGGDLVEQGQELSDVVVVPAVQRHTARTIKAVPDKAQLAVRAKALDEAKTVTWPCPSSLTHAPSTSSTPPL